MSLVVVGDALLDVDITGTVTRVCPDAPVPVVDVTGEEDRAGGAALAASLATGPVQLVTAIADDADGHRLWAALDGLDVVAGVTASTSVKARVRCSGQSLLRLDRGGGGPAPHSTDAMLDAVRSADAVLVSDYGRGLAACPRLREVLSASRVPVVWDPHPRGPRPVAGVSIATPNLAEAAAFSGTDGPDAAGVLRHRWRAAAVAVTTGSRGAVLDRGAGPEPVPAPVIEVTDTCGAGDRFAVAAAEALMAGADAREAVVAAVEAASGFLARGGLSEAKPGPTPEAVIAAVRARGGTVVATGGCFDLVHAGHAQTLAAARALGDCLVVCLNSDDSVRRLKGPRRPIMGEADRAALLRALACVDAVVVFDEDDPRQVLARLRPDIWVKGGDYAPDDLPEADLVRSWGGRIVTTPLLPGRSTTRLAGALADAG